MQTTAKGGDATATPEAQVSLFKTSGVNFRRRSCRRFYDAPLPRLFYDGTLAGINQTRRNPKHGVKVLRSSGRGEISSGGPINIAVFVPLLTPIFGGPSPAINLANRRHAFHGNREKGINRSTSDSFTGHRRIWRDGNGARSWPARKNTHAPRAVEKVARKRFSGPINWPGGRQRILRTLWSHCGAYFSDLFDE